MSEPSVTKSSVLSTLLENHRLSLAFLERRVGTKADAEDILQTAFVKMMESPASLRNEERTDRYYVPAAAAYRERAADKGAVGMHVVAWQHTLDQKWPAVRFVDVTVETDGEQHVIDVRIYLNDLAPQAVRVELYADGVNGGGPVRQEMTRGRPLTGAAGGWLYSARVAAIRPATDYTARVIPQHPGVAVPLEDARILWQG